MENHEPEINGTQRQILDLIYRLTFPLGEWPTYRVLDLRMDRELGIPDTRPALLEIPGHLLLRQRGTLSFADSDEMRLTLLGVAECTDSGSALEQVAKFLRWIADYEQTQPLDVDLAVNSREYAAVLDLNLGSKPDSVAGRQVAASVALEDPQFGHARALMIRLRVLAGLIPGFWAGGGYQPDMPWDWYFHVDRRRLRTYRGLNGVDDLLALERPRILELTKPPTEITVLVRDHLRRLSASTPVRSTYTQTQHEGGPETARQDHTGSSPELESKPEVGDLGSLPTEPISTEDAPVRIETRTHTPLLAVLREEIAAHCATAFEDGRYDDAIFEAFRYVEEAVQRRTGLADAIGQNLLTPAFKEPGKRRISVSRREGDHLRLFQMFDGAIGLIRGDRAHKARPSLPCRTAHECLRLLAHASVLLDLLDRDVAFAPAIEGYDQDVETLTLRVARSTPATVVLLDERPALVLRRTVDTITVSVTEVLPGEHEVVLIDGSRQGPATAVWLARKPTGANWYRVEEVDIPLFADAACSRPHDASGLRIATREGGVRGQRILPTQRRYTPGDYVSWHWDSSVTLQRAWARETASGPAFEVFGSSSLFDGDPQTAAHAPRTIRITIEPPKLKIRVGERAPLRLLAWKTDGTATWNEPLSTVDVQGTDITIAAVGNGAIIAKGPGRCVLHVEHDGLYAESTVEVAAHPRNAIVEWVSGLPPVTALAWTGTGLLMATREAELWRVNPTDGRFVAAAGLPLHPPIYGGCDAIAASSKGDLAVLLFGHPDVHVLTNQSGYSASYTLTKPELDGTITALAWNQDDLIVAMGSGSLYRFAADADPVHLGDCPDTISRLCPEKSGSGLLAVAGTGSSSLWRIDLNRIQEPEVLLRESPLFPMGAVASTTRGIFVADFYGGRVLRLVDDALVQVADGLRTPNALAEGSDGALYVAEFAENCSVYRILS